MNIVELGPEEMSVIAAGRVALDPTEMQRARVRKGLDAKLAAGVAAPVLASSTALAAFIKVGGGIAIVAAIGTSVLYLSVPRLRQPVARTTVAAGRPAPAMAVAARAPEPPADPSPPVAAPAVAATPPAGTHARVRRREAAPPSSADLAGELGLLTQANAATKAGDVARAAELLRTYDQSHPAGQLTQERAAAGILVHCAAGRVQAARAEARRFLERWPRSPLVARIASSCAAEDKAP